MSESYSIDPDTPLSGVAVTGGIATFTIPEHAYEAGRVMRIIATHDAGSATTSSLEVSTDASVADLMQRIVLLTGLTSASPIHNDNSGAGWAFSANDGGGKLYVKLTPDLDTVPNDYTLKLLVG